MWTEIDIVKEDPVMMNGYHEFQVLFGTRQELREMEETCVQDAALCTQSK